ncbi:CNNM domain-containing protein [Stieleria varia]|uniref:CNNM transmembrane domain-containing protein n=1 Tax=Stieleria varia TaxID=2528005 RepID=A0A5C6AY47_9BACT|nr:CNNM domain-containing protein [Stieleria varia]TWU04387.1 hypothetical protein Pla52n_24270 [Stieleria varia]
MIIAIVLFLCGLGLSAFFSGSETGLYRVSRTRLVLDGLDGSASAKALIWLLNRPAIFVATTLVGNNVANFVTSFALVWGVAQCFGHSSTAELLGPMLMTPVVFVFGELLPKYLFYQAPYRMLTMVRPLLLIATVVFLPVSLVLGLLGTVLSWLTGQTPFRLQLAMARGELDQVMRAGQEAGILGAGQRSLVQQLFVVGNQPAVSFAVPPDRLAAVDSPIDPQIAVQKARRQNHPIILVRRGGRVIGYLRYSNLFGGQETPEVRPVIRGRINDRHLSLLLRMYDAGSEVAVLSDDKGEMRYCVTRRQLLQPMLKTL